jgi:hypothetical protein
MNVLRYVEDAVLQVIRSEIQPAVITGFDTREQLARVLDVSTATIRRWERDGLPVVRRGRLRLYDRQKVRRWLGLDDGR